MRIRWAERTSDIRSGIATRGISTEPAKCALELGGISLSHQLTFDGIEQWMLLPSPKLQRGDLTGVYAWTPSYTGFSERFALAVIRLMKSSKVKPVLLDPFLGGGTSVLAAGLLGLSAVGVDLDPFAVLLSRARVATAADPKRVAELLKDSPERELIAFSEGARGLFRISDLRFASSVIGKVLKAASNTAVSSVFVAITDDPLGIFDSEVVALTAMCIAAAFAAKVVGGSNPVWFKKALRGEIGRTTPLQTVARSISRVMLSDLALLDFSFSRRHMRFLNEDFRHSNLPSASADLILTSPPYLNRLDYVVNHLTALSLLTGLMPIALEELRKTMMGTTKMGEKGEINKSWGKSCLTFLDVVLNHPSQASAKYYYWNYYKYFGDLYLSLEKMKYLARPGASGALVIQTSFYKEVVIPTPHIVVEMASNLGIAARVARTEIVRAHLGALSPRQTRYVPRKTLEECVVALEF